MKEGQALPSEPSEVQNEAYCRSIDRLPFVHLDPGSPSLLWIEIGSYHHPLELRWLLPLLQLHRSEPTPYPGVQVPEQILELLNTEIPDPAVQVFVEIVDRFLHRQRVVASSQFAYSVFEFGTGFIAHPYLAS